MPEAGKPGISIFELQSRLGHSSPEIHAFFPRQLSIRQAIESAFAETFLAKPTLDHERDLDVSAALRFFKAELDPDAAVTTQQEPPAVNFRAMDLFPKIEQLKFTKKNRDFVPTDYDVEYADSVRFGELSTAQQRLVLFIRALIHKPDIIILDEPFSNMSASLRDKCIHFLEAGEMRGNLKSPITKRAANPEATWLKGSNVNPSEVRHRGLSKDQALIMISHVKEEIPDSVRYYMRLPSDPGDGGEPLDFRFGVLQRGSVMSDPKIWDLAWSPPSAFDKAAKQVPQKLSSDKNRRHDENIYEWYTI